MGADRQSSLRALVHGLHRATSEIVRVVERFVFVYLHRLLHTSAGCRVRISPSGGSCDSHRLGRELCADDSQVNVTDLLPSTDKSTSQFSSATVEFGARNLCYRF